MRLYATAVVISALVMLWGCASLESVSDDIGQSSQPLQAESCHDHCMEEFHACRESGGSGGPGASGCAHDKNDCKARCP